MDASVAAKWIFLEEYTASALLLLRRCATENQNIIAPALLPSELTNIVWRRVVRRELTEDEALLRLSRVLALPIALFAYDELYTDAFLTASTYNLPAAYDAHYVALAQRAGCNLWTADERLLHSLAGQLPFVRPIGDYTEDDPL